MLIPPALILESSPQTFRAGRYYSNSPTSLPLSLMLLLCPPPPHPPRPQLPLPNILLFVSASDGLLDGLIFSLHYHLL